MSSHLTEVRALLGMAQAIARLTAPGSRTFDEMIRDTGHACDLARLCIDKLVAIYNADETAASNRPKPPITKRDSTPHKTGLDKDEVVNAAREVVGAYCEYLPVLLQYNHQHGHEKVKPYGQKLWDALIALHATFFEKPETKPETEAAV